MDTYSEIRGLMHPPHICDLLKLLDILQKHWLSALESTVLASVKAFYFLRRIHFGGLLICLSKRGLFENSLGHTKVGEDDTDSSDLEESRTVRGWRKRE